jgi:hypothetical protein
MIDFIHAPANERTLDQIYVFCSIEENGLRGIVAGMIPGLGATPFVTGSPIVLEYMTKMAPIIAKKTGKRIVMYAYTRAEQLASFDP